MTPKELRELLASAGFITVTRPDGIYLYEDAERPVRVDVEPFKKTGHLVAFVRGVEWAREEAKS